VRIANTLLLSLGQRYHLARGKLSTY